MSGDVQPRKRKDKKRKKDELGIEEPRGTAAALGEGDVFMHSQHDHGTGGHWCAKLIFFSLLAVLITLIGLIILENRGLSELEANAVESRYSGVLEGWLEDVPDDDHHDEHTLELTHPDDDNDGHHEDNNLLEDDDHDEGQEHDEESEYQDDENEDQDEGQDPDDEEDEDHDDEEDEDLNDEDEDEDQDEEGDQDDDEDLDDDIEQSDEATSADYKDDYEHQHLISEDINDEDDESQNVEDKDVESEEQNEHDDEDDDEYGFYSHYEVNENKGESNEIDNIGSRESISSYKNEEDLSKENDEDENEDEDEHDEEDNNDEEDVEVEKLENEEPDNEPISTELPALPEDNDHNDDDNIKDEGHSTEEESDKEDYEEYLENDDTDEFEVEHITAPPGNPLVEMEEESSSEQPPDTLAEEEEYEKRQEEIRREEEQSSHMWLKLTVGGALLVATHAVMRRATRSRDSLDDEEPDSRGETPLTDRRLTLIPEEQPKYVPVTKVIEEISRPSIDKVVESAATITKPTLIKKQESEEEKYSDEEETRDIAISAEDNKELYSDEEEVDIDELIEEPKQVSKQSSHVVESKPAVALDPEEELEEVDVEIIDDEQIEEDLEEEDEEEISDVDDAELLTRLEAKYGKLPEPERPGQKNYKDGGNSIEDDWPGEPSDAYWRNQLDSAERDLLQGAWSAAAALADSVELRGSARARWLTARALDRAAEAKRDNALLSRAITAYLHLLKMNERLSDEKLLQITDRTLDRIQFRGNYLNAEPVYRLLIRRFPNDPAYRNNLTISFLMANRADLAEDVLTETLRRWPNDRVALAHYGFVLKSRRNRYEEAAEAFRKALEGDRGPANEARFYYHYGDSLLLLGRNAEAHEVHKRGAALGHFLSSAQRSLYNVPRLKSSPWWKIEETPYLNLAKSLEKSWREILKEAEAAKALYEAEKEGLKERGEWSQLDLFVRGGEIPKRCERAPVTCSIVKSEIAAAGCRRGQVKFSAMAAGTHVRPHVGPTNCRLRMHLGLSNTKDTYIRVDQEIRQWQEGKTLLFDDSFEHEVWHNGTGTRLVLIVDVWHPHLTAAERRQLPAI